MIAVYPKPIRGLQGPPGSVLVTPGGPPGPAGTNLAPFRLVYPGPAESVLDALAGWTRIGGLIFDPSVLYNGASVVRAVKFMVSAEATAGVTGEVQLYDPVSGAYVTGTNLSFNENVPTVKVTSAITPSDSAAANLKTTQRVYEVHARITAPGIPAAGIDLFRVFSRQINVDYTNT